MPDAAHEKIHDGALGETCKVADAGDHDVFDGGVSAHLGEHVREVFNDDDAARAGVLELMAQFARRVERIRVHHRESGAQRTEQRDRVLQQVRHHERDAIPAHQAEAGQIGGEIGGEAIEVGELERHTEIVICGAFGEAPAAIFEDGHKGRIGVGIDLGRSLLGVGGEPEFLHTAPTANLFLGSQHGSLAPFVNSYLPVAARRRCRLALLLLRAGAASRRRVQRCPQCASGEGRT